MSLEWNISKGKMVNTRKASTTGGSEPDCSAVECAAADIERVEQLIAPSIELMRLAHSSAMRASHELGEAAGTGAAHACLGLMEVAMRSLHAANDAARYARHSLRYPTNDGVGRDMCSLNSRPTPSPTGATKGAYHEGDDSYG